MDKSDPYLFALYFQILCNRLSFNLTASPEATLPFLRFFFLRGDLNFERSLVSSSFRSTRSRNSFNERRTCLVLSFLPATTYLANHFSIRALLSVNNCSACNLACERISFFIFDSLNSAIFCRELACPLSFAANLVAFIPVAFVAQISCKYLSILMASLPMIPPPIDDFFRQTVFVRFHGDELPGLPMESRKRGCI